MLIAIGHHRTPSIPALFADDVDLGREERVGCSDDGADVHVVLPVLDGDMKTVPPVVEIGDDGVERPVPVTIDDVASIAVSQQLEIEMGLVGPGFGVWTHTDLGLDRRDVPDGRGVFGRRRVVAH